MRPWDQQPTDFSKRLASLINVIEQITKVPVIPNEQVAQVKQPPFVTWYPLVLDDPVFGDATFNDGLFESTISLDIFADTIAQSLQLSGDLRVYLLDPYTRQILRRDAGMTIREATAPQTRSVTDLPFTGIHHTGFNLTYQYYRNFHSPIDTISSVSGLTLKEDK